MARRTQSVKDYYDLPPAPHRCPQCGGQKLTLHGTLRRTVRQSIENGHPTGKRLVGREEQKVLWNRTSCSECGAQCDRTDERVQELQEEVERLHFQLAIVTGRSDECLRHSRAQAIRPRSSELYWQVCASAELLRSATTSSCTLPFGFHVKAPETVPPLRAGAYCVMRRVFESEA